MTNATRWTTFLTQAMSMELTQRRTFLEQAREDETLVKEARDLLDQLDQTGAGISLFKHCLDYLLGEDSDTPRPLPAAAGYEVLEVIAAGGMGSVYLARRLDSGKKVALKVLKPEHAAPDFIKRFENEYQVLAALSHPSIARVYEAGETENGLPFIAMDYFPGLPIHLFCNGLGVKEKVGIMLEVCDALRHAHAAGIIHRDLKPSNILVMNDGDRFRVNVIDFGIARTLGPARPNDPHTGAGLLGTPRYMAPEQIEPRGLLLDNRVDIYAVGCILHELLTENVQPPKNAGDFDSLREWVSYLLAYEPPPPSRVAGGPHPKHEIGDLDHVVVKATTKERGARYETMAELAKDLQRFQNDAPVEAVPPSKIYRLRKLYQRHQGLVLTVSSLFAALTIALAIAWTRHAEAETKRAALVAAEQEKRAAERHFATLAEWLQSTTDDANANRTPGRQAFLDKLDARTDAALAQLVDFPLLEAELHASAQVAYTSLGAYDRGRHHLDRALLISTARLGADAPEVARLLARQAQLLMMAGRQSAADRAFSEAERAVLAAYGAHHPLYETTVRRHAHLDRYRNDLQSARRRLESLLTLDPPPQAPSQRLLTRRALADIYLAQGNISDALALYREVEARQALATESHDTELLITRTNLANALLAAGELAAAEELHARVLSARGETLGGTHPATARSHEALGRVYLERGKFADAAEELNRAVVLLEALLGPHHPSTISARRNYISSLEALGRKEEALRQLGQAYRATREHHGPNHPESLKIANNYADLLLQEGEAERAAHLLRETVTRKTQRFGPQATTTLISKCTLGQALLALGDVKGALAILDDAVIAGEEDEKFSDYLRGIFRTYRGRAYQRLGRFSEAEADYRVAHELLSQQPNRYLKTLEGFQEDLKQRR